MTPEQNADKWKEICFILSKSVSQKMIEKDFEGQVVRAVEALGWKEFKNEIKRQAVIKIGHGKKLIPDLVVYREKDDPLIAIEVKRPAEDLSKDDVSSQLQSYMRILKTEYGLAIGKTIRFFYDGALYPQKEPVLLCEIKFEEDSTEGQEFVSNINKESLAKQNHTQYLDNLIIKVKEKRSIKKLKRVLESKETKDKVLAYLRNEFIEYGSEIVEDTLKSMDIQIGGTTTAVINPPKSGSIRGKVLDLIQTSQDGVNRKEICNKLSISGKQASNVIYKLMRYGQIKKSSDYGGVWVATHSPPFKKPPKKASKPTGHIVNIREKVLKTIARYENGARIAKIIERTGLENKQVRNALHALKKGGKVITVERGFFKAV
jgi:predicted Zn-ribbon and HTH transcriptional regulator